MTDDRQPARDEDAPGKDETGQRLSRRYLIAGSGVTVAATALNGPVLIGLAQEEASPVPPDVATAEASPVASPVAEVNPDVFRVICQTATGVSGLDDEAVTQLLGLIEADSASAAGLQALVAAGSGLSLTEPPAGAAPALTNIVEFFYLGQFNGAPVENRADLFAGLVSFQTLPYVTIPAICKAYGYWATEVDLPERA